MTPLDDRRAGSIGTAAEVYAWRFRKRHWLHARAACLQYDEAPCHRQRPASRSAAGRKVR